MLANEAKRRRSLRGGLYLCGLKKQAKDVLERGGYLDIIGPDNIFLSETEAMEKILKKIDAP